MTDAAGEQRVRQLGNAIMGLTSLKCASHHKFWCDECAERMIADEIEARLRAVEEHCADVENGATQMSVAWNEAMIRADRAEADAQRLTAEVARLTLESRTYGDMYEREQRLRINAETRERALVEALEQVRDLPIGIEATALSAKQRAPVTPS